MILRRERFSNGVINDFQVNVSPAVTRNERRTPPLSSTGIPISKPIAMPSVAAYAGPTFHASPAPSALPIPSFYSKSVPESPGLRGLKQGRDIFKSRDSESSKSPLPTMSLQKNTVQREESPLDIFFKADKEEKARARSASSTQNAASATGPFQPPVSPRSSRTPPASISQSRPRWSQDKRSSSGGIFALEMDSPSNPRSPLGPAFSTPYSERINAARDSSQIPQWEDQPSQPQTPANDKSSMLKAYLFNNHPQSAPPAISQPAKQYNQAPRGNIFANEVKVSTHTPRTNGRSSGLRQEVSPSKTPTKTPDRHGPFNSSPTPARQYRENFTNNNNIGSHGRPVINEISPDTGSSSGNRSSNDKGVDLRSMEDSLRKILKLDSAGSSGAFGSIMNGTGGRSPPTNDTNGINGAQRF